MRQAFLRQRHEATDLIAGVKAKNAVVLGWEPLLTSMINAFYDWLCCQVLEQMKNGQDICTRSRSLYRIRLFGTV